MYARYLNQANQRVLLGQNSVLFELPIKWPIGKTNIEYCGKTNLDFFSMNNIGVILYKTQCCPGALKIYIVQYAQCFCHFFALQVDSGCLEQTYTQANGNGTIL